MTTQKFPQTILFDFDGIIIDTIEIPDWAVGIATQLEQQHRLSALDQHLTISQIAADLKNAARAVSYWTNASSMEWNPIELPENQWITYLTVDWSAAARERLEPLAKEIVCMISDQRYQRHNREGIEELLETIHSFEIPMGIVSNTPCGSVTREYLKRAGLSHYFQIEIYSNEVGIRKPNPDILHKALDVLNADAAHSWFIGDRLDRDIVCAKRAGMDMSILMESRDSGSAGYLLSGTPDLIVKDPRELQTRLMEHFNLSVDSSRQT